MSQTSCQIRQVLDKNVSDAQNFPKLCWKMIQSGNLSSFVVVVRRSSVMLLVLLSVGQRASHVSGRDDGLQEYV
jgi:hypothetical protein